MRVAQGDCEKQGIQQGKMYRPESAGAHGLLERQRKTHLA